MNRAVFLSSESHVSGLPFSLTHTYTLLIAVLVCTCSWPASSIRFRGPLLNLSLSSVRSHILQAWWFSCLL